MPLSKEKDTTSYTFFYSLLNADKVRKSQKTCFGDLGRYTFRRLGCTAFLTISWPKLNSEMSNGDSLESSRSSNFAHFSFTYLTAICLSM